MTDDEISLGIDSAKLRHAISTMFMNCIDSAETMTVPVSVSMRMSVTVF